VADPIKSKTNPDGSVVWWFRVSAGTDSTGKRVQIYKSFPTRREARAEHGRITHELAEHRFVARDGITVNGWLDQWLAGRFSLEETTAATYRHHLRPVRERLGERRLQSITTRDVEDLARWMQAEGRSRGGKKGTGLSDRSVRDTLAAFQRVCEKAVRERLIASNPCRDAERPKKRSPSLELWTDEEAARFEKAAAADRLAPVIALQLLGVRPEEVCGLCWRDVDLTAGTLSIRHARTLVDGRPVEKDPKTHAGKRVLPLDRTLIAQLGAFRKVQAAEKRAAGGAYNDGGYVLCNELGEPSDPARLRRVWYRLMAAAGVPKVTPYTASRHAAASYLARAGVSPAVLAKWMGHTDPGFTYSQYTHARPEDLAAALSALASRRATARDDDATED
jgi:integrase